MGAITWSVTQLLPARRHSEAQPNPAPSKLLLEVSSQLWFHSMPFNENRKEVSLFTEMRIYSVNSSFLDKSSAITRTFCSITDMKSDDSRRPDPTAVRQLAGVLQVAQPWHAAAHRCFILHLVIASSKSQPSGDWEPRSVLKGRESSSLPLSLPEKATALFMKRWNCEPWNVIQNTWIT